MAGLLEDIIAHQNQVAATGGQSNELQHKGMFGIKGTMRDILGTLGDAFLTQSGNNPLYRQQRQVEKEGDAMLGFADNPLAAVERLAAVNPSAARELQDGVARQEMMKEDRELRALKQEEAYKNNVLDRGSRFLDTVNPKNYKDVRNLYNNYLANKRVEAPWELPEEYDQEAVDRIRMGGIPTKDQWKEGNTQEYREEVLDERRINNERRDTTTRRGQTLRDRRAGQAENGRNDRFVKGEQGKDARHDRPKPKSGGGKFAPPPLPPGFKLPVGMTLKPR